jgi:hypothetical protein
LIEFLCFCILLKKEEDKVVVEDQKIVK